MSQSLQSLLKMQAGGERCENSPPGDTANILERVQIAEWQIERAQKVAVIALADLAEHRDGNTGEHVLRVARLTHEMARHLEAQDCMGNELDSEFLRQIGTASILHDIGKVGIPDRILFKPGKLTAEEREIMEKHTVDGGAMLKKAEALLAGSRQFRLAGDIAVYHHEKWAGQGYPEGRRGLDIPLAARIVSVADVFDALTSERPYKSAWTPAAALDYVQAQAASQFDPLVVAALQAVLQTRSEARRIAWQSAMEIGHPTIDRDHRVLLDLVNQISIPATRRDPIALEFVLDELLSYTARHFAREEALIAEAGYPDLVAHQTIHAEMIGEVRQLQSRLVCAASDLGDALHDFLGRWLIQHIMVEDRRYTPFLSGLAVSGIASESQRTSANIPDQNLPR